MVAAILGGMGSLGQMGRMGYWKQPKRCLPAAALHIDGLRQS